MISFKILKKWWFWLIALLVTTFIALYLILQVRYNDKMYARLVDDNGYLLEIKYQEIDNHKLRYLEMGRKDKPLIFAIHGSPGSSLSWQSTFNDSLLVNNVNFVAVDRLGYGFSDFGALETSIKKEAAYLATILKKYRKQHQTILVVGSSYGGPVAARLAMDCPELVDGLYLLSASVAPGEEKIYSISYSADKRWLKWLVPTAISNANTEKLGHEKELQKMADDWDKITAVTTIVHGDADDLIYLENAHFAERKLVHAKLIKKIILPGVEHGLNFSDPRKNNQLMLEAVKRTKKYQQLSFQHDGFTEEADKK